jgi:hypothetical protein
MGWFFMGPSRWDASRHWERIVGGLIASDRLNLNQLEAWISRYLDNLEQDSRIRLFQFDPILL